MGWRDKYNVHPAADVFPMMEGEELAALVEDIKTKGLKTPITMHKNGVLLDGRNRLHALDLAGLELPRRMVNVYSGDDPVGLILSANAYRRQLSKQEWADAIVAAVQAAEDAKARAEKKPRQDGEVFAKGGRGRVNKVKAKAIEEGKKRGISERTIERAVAKAESKKANGKRPPETKKRHTAALGLLTAEQKAMAVEDIEAAVAALIAIRDQLRSKDQEAAA
jgi:ParB-like nuclease family protein